MSEMTNRESQISACQHEWIIRNGTGRCGPLKRCRVCKTSRRAFEEMPAIYALNRPAGQRKRRDHEVVGGLPSWAQDAIRHRPNSSRSSDEGWA